ncbi:MAG: protein kinase [Acidobacteriota bacterium]|nr:protein kinase [Acidobacteriota bacterium]
MQQYEWDRIKEVLKEMNALPSAGRDAWLKERYGSHPEFYNRVVTLLGDGAPTLPAPDQNDAPESTLQEAGTGTVLGAWRLLKPLDEGGMGAVWLAERADAAFTMTAAVKIVKGTLFSPSLNDRFIRERQFLADLKHPNICILLDGGTTPQGRPYLVMEYVEGDVIHRWCETQRPESSQILDLFRQLCSAVAYAHRKGILHRDLKPKNIMVTRDGHIKLMDFGIADSVTVEPKSGAFMPMTPEYASPEQFEGGRVTEASDRYTLGLVLFQLLSGQRPRDADELYIPILKKIRNESQDPVTKEAVLLARDLLAEEPEERPGLDSVISRIDALNTGNFQEAQEVAQLPAYEAVCWHHPYAAWTVENLARRLADETGLKLWLDDWYRLPEEAPDRALGRALGATDCLVVFLADDGNGPWLDDLQSLAISKTISENYRVIPVLLGGADRPERESDLPPFLRRHAWINISEAAFHAELKAAARKIRGENRNDRDGQLAETCPFKGLEAFTEKDHHFFYGREAITQRLSEHVNRYRFLAVLGPSGSGKSSVVQAGLMPLLREEGKSIALFTPAGHPLEELAYALQDCFRESSPLTAVQLTNRLWSDDDALNNIAQELEEHGGPDELVLVIDQFEEIFTLAMDQIEVSRFLDVLLSAVDRPGTRITVVLTMRSDFYGRSTAWSDLTSYLNDHNILIEPMNRDELERAVVEPAHLAGLQLESGLMEKILDDVQGESGELPLLEHALLELYQRRVGNLLTSAAYTEIGGIEGALARRAESEYRQTDAPGRQIIRKMFTLGLIHPGEGADDTRRHADRSELLKISGDPAAGEKLLQRLVKARLLTTLRDAKRGVDQIDVAHEALIRKWSRIRDWMAEDRETARQLNQLRTQAQIWDQAGRDRDHLPRGGPLYRMQELVERESDHLGDLELDFIAAGIHERERAAVSRRRGRNALTVAALVSLILAVFSWLAAHKSERLRILAEQAQTRFEDEVKEANYNQAMMFTREAGYAFEQKEHPQPLLYAVTALSREIPEQRGLPETLGLFANPDMDKDIRLLWTSPVAPEFTAMALSPDGQFLALGETQGMIYLLDMVNGSVLSVLKGHKQKITQLSFTPDSNYLISSGEDRRICRWVVEVEGVDYSSPLHVRSAAGPVRDLLVSPDGTMTATLIEGRPDIFLYDLPSEKPLPPLTGNGAGALCAAFSPDGEFLAVAGDDGILRLWHAQKQTPVSQTVAGSVHAAVFTDNRTLVTASDEPGLQLRSIPDLSPKGRLDNHRAKITDLQRGTRTGELIVSSADGSLSILDLNTRKRITDVCAGITPEGGITRVSASPTSERVLVLTDGMPASADTGSGRFHPLLPGHGDWVYEVSYAPDGSRLASASADGTVKLWDTNTGRLRHTLTGHSDRVWAVTHSPDGRLAASGSRDHDVRLWDTADGSLVRKIGGHADGVWGVAFSPDGQRLASASADRTIRLWNVDDGSAGPVLSGHTDVVYDAAFHPDGRRLASASGDRTIRIWNADTGRARVLTGHREMTTEVAWSPDGRLLASASRDRTVRLWDVETGKTLRVLTGHAGSVSEVIFHPNGRRLATSSDDRTIRLWNLENGETELVLYGHTDSVWGLAFHPDGSRLASASRDHRVRIWDTVTPAYQPVLAGHTHAVSGVAFGPGGRMLASASWDRTVRLWDAVAGKPGPVLEGNKEVVSDVAFHPEGRWSASASEDKTLRLWDTATGKTEAVFRGHTQPIHSLDFHPDGRRLASGSYDKTVRLWDIAAGAPGPVMTGHTDRVYGVAFHPAGELLASTSSDKTVRLWHTADGNPKAVLEGHTDRVYGVAFHPAGRLLASCSDDRTVRLWDITDGSEGPVLTGHKDRIWAVAFHPNGRWLASASSDRTVRLWNVATGEAGPVLTGHTGLVKDVSFSRDGSLLASGSDDASVRLWDLERLFRAESAYRNRTVRPLPVGAVTFHYGYRLDGFQLVDEPVIYLQGPPGEEFPLPHPHERLLRGKPPGVDLIDWVLSE